MPFTYAHYRFGAALLPTLPADVRRTIQRFRRLYDVGLHGPDIFYFCIGSAARLGNKFHRQTGQEFFQRVCRTVRLERAEASLAYLYGVLTHYCLDSICHPLVHEREGTATHQQIETEFDRFLLEKDGRVPPRCQDLSHHLKLTQGECETVAKFYPPATRQAVQMGVRNMASVVRLLAAPEGARRTLMEGGIRLFAPGNQGMLMTDGADPVCAELDAPLEELYEKAAETFPEMLSQLQAHLTYSAPLEEDFIKMFG